ncbi:hypothetical protein Pcinc_002450 [Petrolisthes cinctipes]|uniref:Uncharacterized protein n=1 Tax=Petrolisthes cinctipes TaxID=88211 RepID=A0AAE1GKY9_PETCI|nr:hypothetical protein Pcinc_002450 [Petrolisthes cinctipes]
MLSNSQCGGVILATGLALVTLYTERRPEHPPTLNSYKAIHPTSELLVNKYNLYATHPRPHLNPYTDDQHHRGENRHK